MKTIIRSYLPILCLLVLIPSRAATPVDRLALQKQDIALIQRISDYARDAEDSAERIDSYIRVPDEYSRQCHLSQLDALKSAINSMAPTIERLAATRNGLDNADNKAVTRIVILAVELAQSANAAIVQANNAEDTPSLSAEYRRLVEQCYRESNDLVKALNAGVIELK